MNELAECKALNENKNNNNNGESSVTYYVGAYCTSKGVYAGVFTDSACTKKAPSGTYELYSNNGASLPTEALVSYGKKFIPSRAARPARNPHHLSSLFL
jgi:lipid-binding SYLF domain-containing protein